MGLVHDLDQEGAFGGYGASSGVQYEGILFELIINDSLDGEVGGDLGLILDGEFFGHGLAHEELLEIHFGGVEL